MKKVLLVLFFLMAFSQLNAQEKPMVFGLRVGGDLSWISPNVTDYESGGVVGGITWGFISEFFLMENYAILTGFNVNFNGGKLEYPAMMDVNDSTVMGQLNRNYNLKYLQIPLCFKMQFEVSEKLVAFGKLGVGTAFNLSAKADDDFVYDGGEESTSKKNISDDIALMRESLIIGGGVEYKIKGSTAIVVDLTYDNAFNNLLTGDNPALPDSDIKAKLNFLELGVGIIF